jgi:hypothetical protein
VAVDLPTVIDQALADPLVCGYLSVSQDGRTAARACDNCRENAAMKLVEGWTVDQVLAAIEASRTD